MRALALMLVAGCAAADAASHTSTAPAPAPAPIVAQGIGINPGETMAYEVSLGGLLAGEAAFGVGQIGDWQGHKAIIVTSRAVTAGAVDLVKHVVDEATTVIDADSGRPLQLNTYVELGGTKYKAEAVFHGAKADITSQKEDEAPRTQHVDFSRANETVYDTHSAMGQIRGWRAAPGTVKSVFVVGGKRLWRVDMTYVGAETVGSELGNRKAIRLDGASFRARANKSLENQKPTRTFSVWLSDDGDRVPLKVVAHTELGDVTMTLTDYRRP